MSPIDARTAVAMTELIPATVVSLRALGLQALRHYTFTHVKKWFELGKNSGAIASRAILVSEIRMFATSHDPLNRLDWRLDVKASRLEIRRKNNLVEMHCKKLTAKVPPVTIKVGGYIGQIRFTADNFD